RVAVPLLGNVGVPARDAAEIERRARAIARRNAAAKVARLERDGRPARAANPKRVVASFSRILLHAAPSLIHHPGKAARVFEPGAAQSCAGSLSGSGAPRRAGEAGPTARRPQ